MLTIALLTTFDEVSLLVEIDPGQSIKALPRVSHLHIFGIKFIIFLTGLIFSFCEINRLAGATIIALAFVAIWVDILSRWFTRYQPIFAYTVIMGGVLMGIALALQVSISLN